MPSPIGDPFVMALGDLGENRKVAVGNEELDRFEKGRLAAVVLADEKVHGC